MHGDDISFNYEMQCAFIDLSQLLAMSEVVL